MTPHCHKKPFPSCGLSQLIFYQRFYSLDKYDMADEPEDAGGKYGLAEDHPFNFIGERNE
jgi:hypothetical protein